MENRLTGDVYLSSDWHLGHANIAGPNTSVWKEGYRNFDSLHEMNKTIIDNINKTVKQEDTILFHGDFSFGGHTNIPNFRRQIFCQNIHFIRGNHDQHIHKYKEFFSSVQDYWEGTINGIPWVAMHYALRVWMGSHKGFLHTYGHSHASLERYPYGKSMDVGIDNAYRLLGEYRPFKFEEVYNILSKREIQFADHHSKDSNVR